MSLQRETLKKIRGLIVFTIFMLVLLWNYKVLFAGLRFLWRVLLPFVIGCGIAFVLNLPVSFFERKLFRKVRKGARQLSLLLTIAIAIGVVCTVAFLLLPELGKTITHLGANMNAILPEVQRSVVDLLQKEPELAEWISELDVSWETMSEYGIKFLQSGAAGLFSSTMETVKSIISGLTTFVIGFVFACYILLQKERLYSQVKKVLYAFLPRDWAEIILAFSSLSNDIFSRFFSGQCLEALILGGMFLVLLFVLRMPYALLISVVIAITALIPIFGAFIGCIVGVLLIFTASPIKAFLFIIIFFVLQQVEGDFIYPHVVGRSVGLPSIWVLFSVSVGAGLMGVVGMVLFIPISSVVYSMMKGIVHRRLRRRGIKVE